MQTQQKLTPEEELRYLYELYGAGDHARIYTLLTDALNVLGTADLGDTAASRRGLNEMAAQHGTDGRTLAQDAALAAVREIAGL